jgi:hypothetical protein
MLQAIGPSIKRRAAGWRKYKHFIGSLMPALLPAIILLEGDEERT